MGKTGALGALNNHWRGGRVTDPRGYVLLRRPDHPDADVRGYVYEHRVVAEGHLGRRLLPTEHVHHRNGDKGDNRWDNLQVMGSRAEHSREHRQFDRGLRDPDEPNPIVTCRCGCGGTLLRFDDRNRPRHYLPHHQMRGRAQELTGGD